MTTSTPKLATLISVCLAGCGEAAAPPPTTVRDSAGIEIVINDVDPAEVPEWRLAEEPMLSIGDPAPTPEYELYRVYYARSFPGGRIAVSMNLTEIRIYDDSGSYLLTIGRDGEGPGEFQFLWDAHPLDNDEIRALDIRNRRVAFFNSRTGDLLRESPLVTHWSNPNGVGVLRDYRYAGVLPRSSADPPSTPDLRVVVHNREGTATDTIASFSVPDRPEPRPNTQQMYGPYFSSAAAGQYVWAGWQGHYEIKRYHADKGLDRIIRSSAPSAEVTEEMKAAAGATVSGEPMTVQRVFPTHLPYWDKVLASPSGWLWVRRYPSPLDHDFNTWDIFDPDGLQVALIRVPFSGRISELGDDYVLGVFRNDLDVERVQKYEIIRTTASPGS